MGLVLTEHTPAPGLAASVFGGLRARLFGIAYRVLGSAAEAEDVVQDAWLRWQSTDTDRGTRTVASLGTDNTEGGRI